MTLSTTTHRLLKRASRSEPNPRHNLNRWYVYIGARKAFCCQLMVGDSFWLMSITLTGCSLNPHKQYSNGIRLFS